MRIPSFSGLTLLLALGFALQGCTNTFPPDKIDPAGDLSRKDYLALRDRGEKKKEKSAATEDSNPATADGFLPPPIPVMPVLLAPAPPPATSLPRKNVSVSMTEDIPLRDVLMELGREGRVNLELDPRIQGGIIFTAHNQPFDEVIKRICALAGLRHRIDGAFMRIELDEPYQQTYPVDYLSLTRRSTSEVTIATNVFDVDVTSANGSSTGSRNNGSGSDNNSVAKIAGASDADFWSELEKSMSQVLATSSRARPLLKEADPAPGNGPTPANFSIDRQAGLVTVFGNSGQQEAISHYLRKLQRKATAQVLIEARIVEVELNDEFQSGINWRSLFGGAFNAAARFGTVGAGAPFTTATTAADGVFTASVNDKDFSGILNLVRTFGATRVLSSPRLTVLNNQTAVMKVARNEVYFVTSAQFPTTVSTAGVPVSGTPVFSSTPRTVPVGLVMTVQPAIDAENGRVTMTLRPTISRVVDQVNDPSIGLNAAQAGVSNPVQSVIPVLAVREMDSVLQINSGEVAIMGGLMQDSSINTDQGVPPFDALPVVGNLAKSRDNKGATSELVILLRATILNNPQPDAADADLYQRYNRDPRPFPLTDS
ncbi:MAG: secretin N-terminal domain-containing protein [Alphaproteobacteria bacterium]|nr:secretin N-terminal domain-containing protein [Alphaproteobacteria bacterium]